MGRRGACARLALSPPLLFFIDYVHIERAAARLHRHTNLASGFNHSFNCAAHISAPGEGYTRRSSQHLSPPPPFSRTSAGLEYHALANGGPVRLPNREFSATHEAKPRLHVRFFQLQVLLCDDTGLRL